MMLEKFQIGLGNLLRQLNLLSLKFKEVFLQSWLWEESCKHDKHNPFRGFSRSSGNWCHGFM